MTGARKYLIVLDAGDTVFFLGRHGEHHFIPLQSIRYNKLRKLKKQKSRHGLLVSGKMKLRHTFERRRQIMSNNIAHFNEEIIKIC